MASNSRKVQKMGPAIQDFACREKKRNKTFKDLAMCIACQRQRGTDTCRFKGLRKLDHSSANGALMASGFIEGGDEPPIFDHPHSFSGLPEVETMRDLQFELARKLRPILETELEVIKGQDFFLKANLGTTLSTCDWCSTSILFTSHFCTRCGQELCAACFSGGNIVNEEDGVLCTHAFQPCTTLPLKHLTAYVADVVQVSESGRRAAISSQPTKAALMKAAADRYYSIPRLEFGQTAVFDSLWSQGLCLVVSGQRYLKGQWTPEVLERLLGGRPVAMSVISNGTGPVKTERPTFSKFLQYLKGEIQDGHTRKLADFPPSSDFKNLCPQQNKDFQNSLPFGAYTSEDGFLNLVSHYALDGYKTRAFKPDLGPKLYFATADTGRVGSTKLHRDCTSAANILVFATTSSDLSGNKIGAEWTIFKREDTEKVYAHLLKTHPRIAPDSLLHHEVFVNSDDCEKLALQGVHPFRFTQEVGDVVFINAGCLHQVSNHSSCIKIAVDFIDPFSITASSRVMEDFRLRRDRDRLQLKLVLFHAWKSISSQIELTDAHDHGHRKRRKNAQQRKSVAGRNAKGRNLAKKRNDKMPPDLRASQFCCPDQACERITERLFTKDTIWAHIRDCHRFNVPLAQRDELRLLPGSQWKAAYVAIRQRANSKVS